MRHQRSFCLRLRNRRLAGLWREVSKETRPVGREEEEGEGFIVILIEEFDRDFGIADTACSIVVRLLFSDIGEEEPRVGEGIYRPFCVDSTGMPAGKDADDPDAARESL